MPPRYEAEEEARLQVMLGEERARRRKAAIGFRRLNFGL
jgi:hypothetical protein